MKKKMLIVILALFILLNGITYYLNPINNMFGDQEDEGWSYIEYTNLLG